MAASLASFALFFAVARAPGSDEPAPAAPAVDSVELQRAAEAVGGLGRPAALPGLKERPKPRPVKVAAPPPAPEPEETAEPEPAPEPAPAPAPVVQPEPQPKPPPPVEFLDSG